jgi:hypothetical protein
LNVNNSTDNSNANITAHLKFSFSHCFQDPCSSELGSLKYKRCVHYPGTCQNIKIFKPVLVTVK